jgi:hypothetical protein
VAGILGQVSFQLSRVSGGDMLLASAGVGVVSMSLQAVAAVLAITIVRRVTARTEALAQVTAAAPGTF